MNKSWLLFLPFALEASMLKSVPELAQSYKCQKEIKKLNLEWQATKDWKGHPTTEGEIQLKRPTQKFAHWIVLEKIQDKEVMSLINPLQVLRVELNSNCQSAMSVYKHYQYSNPKEFTDQKLMSIFTKEKKGIILLWSPGMDHSFSAIQRLTKLSRELKIPLHYVLDPFASEKNALASLKSKKLTLPVIEKNSSLELFYRDATIHYPSFLLYKNGQFVSNLIPGLMTEHDYKQTIQRYLGSK
jgi:hypothetical protein